MLDSGILGVVAWRDVCRTLEVEASSPRAAAERVAHRLGAARDGRRQTAKAVSASDGQWSVSVAARESGGYLYSAVVKGTFRPTDRGCLFEGNVRPGWATFLFNMTLVVIAGAGAMWFTVDAAAGTGDAGSRLGRLALAAFFAMTALAIGRMIYRDLRRLTADLEAEFRAAIKP